MNWIFDHFQLVIAVAAAVAAWLNDRRKKAGGAGTEGEAPPQSTVTGEDDQTRRIQEEIRRKIAERRGQAQAPAAPVQAEPPPEAWHQPAPPVLSPRPAAQPVSPGLRDLLS